MTKFEFPTYAKQNDKILNYSQTTSFNTWNKSKKIIMIESIKEEQFIKIASQIRFKENTVQQRKITFRYIREFHQDS